MERVSFQSRESPRTVACEHVSLGDARIRRLVQQLPRVVATEPIPCVRLPDLPAEIVGYWSLWRIALDTGFMAGREDHPDLPPRRRSHPGAHGPADLGCLLEDRPEVEQLGPMTDQDVTSRRLPSPAVGSRAQGRRRIPRTTCPAPAATQAGAGEGPVCLPGAPGSAEPHRLARSPPAPAPQVGGGAKSLGGRAAQA